jgi:hypothetical protein
LQNLKPSNKNKKEELDELDKQAIYFFTSGNQKGGDELVKLKEAYNSYFEYRKKR